MKAKYPLLPRSIVKQLNGKYRCMKTLKWYTAKELERYCAVQPNTPQITEEDKHQQILLSRWDLNY